MIPGWPGVLTDETLRVMLAVYVDDFKLAGVEQDIEPAWKTISDTANLEPLAEMGRYLGCNHAVGVSTLTDADDIIGGLCPEF
jgi:hypothetical protein